MIALNRVALGGRRFSDIIEKEKYFDQSWQLFMQGLDSNK